MHEHTAFKQLLLLSHEFIFNRKYYFQGKGRDVLDEFLFKLKKLPPSQLDELLFLLSGPPEQRGLRSKLYFQHINDNTIDRHLRELLIFYYSYHKTNPIKQEKPLYKHKDFFIPNDQKVEDAGLYDGILVNPRFMIQFINYDIT